MAKVSDIEFQSIVRNEIEQAVGYYDTEFSQDRIDAMNYYLGEPFGNEQADRSQVVATEVSDTVEHIMPSLMRLFTQSDEYVRFSPTGPEDVELAEQASDYCNWVITNQNNGFTVLHNWFKDALLLKLGAVKFYYEDLSESHKEEYVGLTEQEMIMLLSDEEVEIVGQGERVVGEPMMMPDGMMMMPPTLYDITIRRVKTQGRIKIDNIPPEEFLISKRAKSLNDAHFVAHRTTMTVSDLIEMGYDRDEVEKYAGTTDLDLSEERTSRFEDIETNSEFDSQDPTMRDVLVTESYIKSDYDGDGIAEFRRVLSVGSGYHILENEECDMVPFAILSPILMPHRAIGRSVAERVMDIQLIKSTLMRQLLDNIYNTNNSRVIAVEGQVNLDDLLTNRPGGVVRTRAPGMVQPLQVADVSGAVFPALEYMDRVKEQRTGISRQSMGLDADSLQSTTATAVSAMQAASQGQIEMIARVFAETGVRDLFLGILHLATKYETKQKMIRLRNEFVVMDPRQWSTQYDVSINVGLGTGQRDQQLASLYNLVAKQEQIMGTMGMDNPIVNPLQYRNTLAKIAELSGFKNVEEFFGDPRNAPPKPPQQPQQDPRIAMEMQKMQADMQIAQQKAAQDLQLQKEKMQMEFAFKREQMAAELQLRQQELQFEQQLRAQQLAVGVNTSTNLPRV
jgi:hypothetical protein